MKPEFLADWRSQSFWQIGLPPTIVGDCRSPLQLQGLRQSSRKSVPNDPGADSPGVVVGKWGVSRSGVCGGIWSSTSGIWFRRSVVSARRKNLDGPMNSRYWKMFDDWAYDVRQDPTSACCRFCTNHLGITSRKGYCFTLLGYGGRERKPRRRSNHTT